MKKAIAFLLILALLGTLAGCKGGIGNATTTTKLPPVKLPSQTTMESDTATTAATTTAATTTSTTRVTTSATTAEPYEMFSCYRTFGTLNDAYSIAVGHLGAFTQEPEDVIAKYMSDYGFSVSYEYIDLEGRDLFVIIPKYDETVLHIYRLSWDGKRGEQVNDTNDLIFLSADGKHGDFEIVAENPKNVYTCSPTVDRATGMLDPADGLLDISFDLSYLNPSLSEDFLYGVWGMASEDGVCIFEFNDTGRVGIDIIYNGEQSHTLLIGTYEITEGNTVEMDVYDADGDAQLELTYHVLGSYDEDRGIFCLTLTLLTKGYEDKGLVSGVPMDYEYQSNELTLIPTGLAAGGIEIDWLALKFDGDWIVEIPYVYGPDNDAIEAINEDLQAMYDYYVQFEKDTDGGWLDWRADIYLDESYLQIVMLCNEYPTYGTDGDIYSWNYNIAQEELEDFDDAIEKLDFDIERVMSAIEEVNTDGTINWDESYIHGFRYVDEWMAVFYISALVENPDADDWARLFTVICDNVEDTYIATPYVDIER